MSSRNKAFARTSGVFLISALSAAVAGVMGAVTPAQAQEQEQETLEEITVTGSRIRQTSGFTTPVPVTSLTPDELFNYEPGSTIAEQLDALPQFFGNTSIQEQTLGNIASSGTASLNLRNLGSNRTLVLFDGYRVVPSSKQGSVNVDAFPTALIRSVDVVTGGASAAYGADAVGGVVNFIIDREFEGVDVSASVGRNEAGDGENWNLSLAGGKGFLDDRLHIIGSLEARKIDGFTRTAAEVDEMQRWGWVTNPEWSPGAPAGVPQRLTLPWVASTVVSPTGLILNTGTELDMMRFSLDGEEITPFRLGEVSSTGGPGSTQSTSGGPDALLSNDAFDGGITGADVANHSAFLGVQYDFTDAFSAFGQIMYGRTEATMVQDRGSYLFGSRWAPRIAVDNAFLPDNVRQIMLDNGLEEFQLHKNGAFIDRAEIGHGRENNSENTTLSYSGGFDWDLPFRNWHLRGVYQEGEAERTNIFGNRFRVDRAFLAMDAVRDPATGAIVCRVQLFNPTPAELAASPSVQGRISTRSAPTAGQPGDPGAIPLRSPIGLDNTVEECVPFNVLGSGNITADAMNYVMGDPKIGTGFVDQQFAELLLNGELYRGWGPGSLDFAAGLTWREQSFEDNAYPIAVDELGPPLNDPALGIRGIPPGYTSGSGNLHYISTLPVISGDAKVWEYFAEVIVPVWQGSLFEQSQQLGVDLAFRQSDYERSGTVDSWKIGIDFQLMNDLRLRYTKSRDVREPTFSELFDQQGGNAQILDPRFNNIEFQVTSTSGGNPNLNPEEAETVTAGIVYTPSFSALEGLQVSLDWYDIAIDGAVGSYGEQRIVNECFLNNAQSLCEFITLSDEGLVVRMLDVYQNVAAANVEGYDLEVVYRVEPDFFDNDFETFNLRALTGYVKERSDTPLDGVPQDISGTLGSPDLTSVVTGTYGLGPWSFLLQARYTDSVAIDGTWVEGVDVDDNSLPSITWWNARLGYSGETSGGASWRVGFNIQNLFDKSPVAVPSISSRFPVQSFTGDLYGRRYNLNVNYSW